MEASSAVSTTPVSSLEHSGGVVTQQPATPANTTTTVTTLKLPSRSTSIATSAICAVPAFFVVVVSKFPKFQRRTFYEAHETFYRWVIGSVLGKQVPEQQPENATERVIDDVVDVTATVVVDVVQIAAPVLNLAKLPFVGSSIESVAEVVIDDLENKFEEREHVKPTDEGKKSSEESMWLCFCCRSAKGQ